MKSAHLSRFMRIVKEEGLKEVASRYANYLKCKIISKLREREWKRFLPQEELLTNLFKEPFTLIILDACRYDYFKKHFRFFINGRLKAVKSPAPNTPTRLKKIFRSNAQLLKYVRIFSANPHLNSKAVYISEFRAIDYVKEKIIDVWDWGWDSELGTVHPYTVVKAVERIGLRDKNIIWFIQPHFPWIGRTRILIPKKILESKEWIINVNRYLAKQIKKGKISKQTLVRAYEDNLLLVLDAVRRLLNNVEPIGRVVITSDHGELLGEYGAYGHPSYLSFPEQRIVPWLEVSY